MEVLRQSIAEWGPGDGMKMSHRVFTRLSSRCSHRGGYTFGLLTSADAEGVMLT